MNPVIEVQDIVTRFGKRTIHDGVNLHIDDNEIYGILGESGSGKSVLMKEMIMLLEPSGGDVSVLGKSLKNISFKDAQALRSDWGVLFQFGALFSSLTVAENIEVQLKEYTNISAMMRANLVRSKLALVGLEPHVARLYPSELSGGMVKRAALARALAMEPKLLFLDEPTSGLDPLLQQEFESLIFERKEQGASVIMSSHIFQEIESMCDKAGVIREGEIVSVENVSSLSEKRTFKIEIVFNDKDISN